MSVISEISMLEKDYKESKTLKMMMGSLAENEGRMIGLFALLVIISGNFLGDLFPLDVQKILAENVYVKHIFSFLTLFFFVYLTMPDIRHQGPGVVFIIYIIFLMSAKLPAVVWFTLVGLITILYLQSIHVKGVKDHAKEKGENEVKKTNDNLRLFEHTLIPLNILLIMGVTIFGFFDVIRIYFNIPAKKRPSLIHFFFEKDLK
jgi:hypothetical protein